MKKMNKILVIIILVLSIIGVMVSMGVVYSYATNMSNNTTKNETAESKTVVKYEENNKKQTQSIVKFTEKTETVYATTNVNIRTEPNVNSQQVGVLVKGNSITRIATGSNGWDKVKYNNTIAYISHNYLSTNKVIVEETIPTQNTNPDNYLIQNVPFIAQNPQYPNGCEAASTTMLLNYYGMKISLTDFINNYLKMGKVYTENSVRYGPDPEICYAGDPASLHGGWGCFSTAIENAVNKLINEKYTNKYTVQKNTSNASLSELAKSKKPFVIWTTITYDVVKGQYTWKSYDGTVTYTYPKDQHAIVVIGQDDNYYYVNDPLKTKGNTKIAKATLEKSFDSMGRKATFVNYR